MDLILFHLVALVAVVIGEDCLVETQKCSFPFSSPGSGELHYSCQATSNSSSSLEYFCRSQVGEKGQERHTYGLCNGGCYDLDAVTPMIFEEDDIMAGMCRTAASPCKFPFIWEEKEYLSCTTDGVDQFNWCALEVDGDGVLVKDRWGKCDMSVCAKEVKEEEEIEVMEAVAEFKDSVVGVVVITQEAPDNPLDIKGKVEGLPEGQFKLRVLTHSCEHEEGSEGGMLLSGTLDSDGNSYHYVSSQQWQLTLYSGETHSKHIVGMGLEIEEQCKMETNQVCDNPVPISCANIVLKSEQTVRDNTVFLIIVIVVVILFLFLLLCICLYCCFWRRRQNPKIFKVEEDDQRSIDQDMYLGSRSKSPLFDELSIPFIDASLPPTPKTGRSQNALEILLGGSLGSSSSLERDT